MLTSKERSEVQKAIAKLQKLLDSSRDRSTPSGSASKASASRSRRSRKDASAFRKQVKSAVKKGESVLRVAAANGVTTSYIYQILNKR